MSELIERQEAIDRFNVIRPVDPKKDEYTKGIDVGIAMCIVAVKDQPTIQPEKEQLSKEGTTSDLISRTATIDAVNNAFDRETILTLFVRSIALRAIRDMPSAQPEPSIPLSWVEKYIEWLKSLDNEFVNLAAAHISVMVKKWRGEQHE